MTTSELILYGIIIHLFCDWFLQNHWMASNKHLLAWSFAGWLHGLIHIVGMMLIFSYWWAVVIGLLHIIIDTRKPLLWWRRVFHQTTTGEIGLHVAIWQDQVAHILVIALVSLAQFIA